MFWSTDNGRAYGSSALCNFSLLPNNRALLVEAEAGAALMQRVAGLTRGDFQAAVALYNVIGREPSDGYDTLDELLQQKALVPKMSGLVLKKVSGKDWGDWAITI